MTFRQNCEHPSIVKHATIEDRRVFLLGYCLGCKKDVEVALADYTRTGEIKFDMLVYQMTRPLNEHA